MTLSSEAKSMKSSSDPISTGPTWESDVARGGTSISRSTVSKSRSIVVREGTLAGKSILVGLPAATGREVLVAVDVEGPGVGLAGPGDGASLGEASPMGSSVVAQTRT